jgi:hypothetical protein
MEVGGRRRGRLARCRLGLRRRRQPNELHIAAGSEDSDRPHERVGKGERDNYESAQNSRANPRASSPANQQALGCEDICRQRWHAQYGTVNQYLIYAEKIPGMPARDTAKICLSMLSYGDDTKPTRRLSHL